MHGRMPDGLFVRHPEAELSQGLPVVGLLYLLTRTSDPHHLAARLAMYLTDPDDLPTGGAIIPLWVDESDAWFCDAPTWAAVSMKLGGCTLIAAALVPDNDDADANGFLYELVPADLGADAIGRLRAALASD